MTLAALPLRRATATAVAVALVASCATTSLPPIPEAGPGFEPARDERRLWDEARDQERRLLGRVALWDDPLLDDYLLDVTLGLVDPRIARETPFALRVRVVDEPTANAFAFPHGPLYVHSGLLARLESEDQLAMVLAHELAHVEHRHLLRLQRRARNRQIALLSAAIGLSILLGREQAEALDRGHYGRAATIGVLADVVIGLGLGLVFLAAINGYGRDLEAEADAVAFDKLEDAGYDVADGARIYDILLEDAPDPGSKFEQYFLSSHPALEDRIASARAYLASHPRRAAAAHPPRDPTRFARRIRPLLRHYVGRLVDAGEIDRAEAAVERLLDVDPDDPEALRAFAAVRVARSRTAPPERRAALLAEAIDALESATAARPDDPDLAWELGLAAFRAGRRQLACDALGRYLALAPGGENAARARDYLAELRRDGACAGPGAD
ncbi:MAG: hypothetical protein D6738_04175 [Acidobacteria bacterium]|nr:MAG: hypothetical protein D6738_04175 [Acidobacteriota bacterium]